MVLKDNWKRRLSDRPLHYRKFEKPREKFQMSNGLIYSGIFPCRKIDILICWWFKKNFLQMKIPIKSIQNFIFKTFDYSNKYFVGINCASIKLDSMKAYHELSWEFILILITWRIWKEQIYIWKQKQKLSINLFLE